jgi:hypothetical protein
MKYLYLLYADESKTPAPGSAEMNAVLDAYGRYFQEVSQKGLIRGGDPVMPSATATTVRVRGGSTKTSSGPFASGKEQIIGFYVLDCKDQKEAVSYGAKIPAASHGAIEVRPILEQG